MESRRCPFHSDSPRRTGIESLAFSRDDLAPRRRPCFTLPVFFWWSCSLVARRSNGRDCRIANDSSFVRRLWLCLPASFRLLRREDWAVAGIQERRRDLWPLV